MYILFFVRANIFQKKSQNHYFLFAKFKEIKENQHNTNTKKNAKRKTITLRFLEQ